jgi:hypothetical protein
VSDDLVSQVERSIRAGDPDRVRDLLLPLKETERRKLAKHFRRGFALADWSPVTRFAPRQVAGRVAWTATATARELVTNGWALQGPNSFDVDPRLTDVILGRGRKFAGDFVRIALRDNWFRPWSLVRRAVREGLIEHPEGSAYVQAMIHGVSGGSQPGVDSSYLGLLADDGLLDDDVWLIFEEEVGSDLANAAVWTYGKDGSSGSGDNRWTYALTRLAAEGRLDRQRLLDASLDALMRDFRASTLGWYVSFHEALEPTREERVARLELYLSLVTAPAPVAVKEGLAALNELGDAVPADELARVSTAPLLQPQKAHALAMLRLLDAAARRDEATRPVVLAAAAQALAHEKPDVQERALKLLERHEDAVPHAELLPYLDAVAPQLRSRLEQLTGLELDREIAAPPLEELVGPAAVAVREGRWPDPRLPEPKATEPLEPVENVDELIELASGLLEGQGTGDDAERFLDGLSRLCGERPPNFEARTRGLRERATPPWAPFPEATSGHALISILVAAWVSGSKPVSPARETIGGLLAGRVVEVAGRARKRSAAPLVSVPTHRGGWIDPEALATRSQPKSGVFRRGPGSFDLLVARLRALSATPIALMPQLTVGRSRWGLKPPRRVGVQILSMPPELEEVHGVVQSLRWMGRDEVDWYFGDPQFPVEDALGARWLLTLLPAFPEIQFARALTAIVDFVDVNPYRHPEVVLEWMLDPGMPLRDPAWTAVAAAFVAKSPDLQRAAADVVVATVADGRFDAERLGHGLAWLLASGFGTLSRIEGPLRDAARVSPLHSAQVLRALEAFLAGCSPEQKHMHVPLGLALDLAAGLGLAVESEPARMAAARVGSSASKTSKVGKAANGLLGLERDEAARSAILRLAAFAAQTTAGGEGEDDRRLADVSM